MAIFQAALKIGSDGDDENFVEFNVGAEGVEIVFPNAEGPMVGGTPLAPASVTVPIKQFIGAMAGFVALLQTLPIEDAKNG